MILVFLIRFLFADRQIISARNSTDYHYLLDMGHKENFKFTVSILSKGASFSISNESDWRNKSGFLVALDKKLANTRKHVFLKYCTTIVDGAGDDKCEPQVKQVDKKHFSMCSKY